MSRYNLVYFNEEWNENRTGEIQQGRTLPTGSASNDTEGSR